MTAPEFAYTYTSMGRPAKPDAMQVVPVRLDPDTVTWLHGYAAALALTPSGALRRLVAEAKARDLEPPPPALLVEEPPNEEPTPSWAAGVLEAFEWAGSHGHGQGGQLAWDVDDAGSAWRWSTRTRAGRVLGQGEAPSRLEAARAALHVVDDERERREAAAAQKRRSGGTGIKARRETPPPLDDSSFLDVIRVLADARSGLVWVPDLVRALLPRADLPTIHATLDRMARAYALELRPDSRVGAMRPEDAAVCPKGLTGVPLSYMRELKPRAPEG